MRAIKLCGLAAFIVFLKAITIQATEATKTSATATWEKSSGDQFIAIDISPLLSAEQREIVNSGFSTLTILGISEKKMAGSDHEPEIRLVCKVKYDTWEEKYVTTKIDPLPMAKFTGNKIESWSNQCLRYRFENQAILNKLAQGGQLFISLQVRQSSMSEASKIKDWLVKQQSGLMQGLYSHMLGDLQLGGRTEVTLDIPPRPNHQKAIELKLDKK
jgi:hypothetical protein